jgi:phage shock protein PspC (stress-responsive transcriptional regulator)
MAPSRPGGFPDVLPSRACDHWRVMGVPAAGVPAPLPSGAPPLTRRRSARFVAGVAGGVADHLGVNVLWVRTAFVVLAAVNGAGVIAYGLLWIFVRQEPTEVQRPFGRAERQQALGLAALGIGAGLAAAALGNTVVGWIVGPLGVAAVGAAVVWREADESQRRRWTAGARSGVTGVTGSGGRAALWRVLAGALFVATGIGVFLLGNLDLSQVQFGMLAVLATLLGVGVLTIPWWVRLMRELGEERRERIIETERAEIAAHLHDSVLQTLALIQRQSDQPREVLRLARGQEREPTGSPPRPRRWRTRTRSTCVPSWSATGRSTTGCARSCSPPGRRWSTRPSMRRWAR